jgi:hypothetical protein
MPSYLLLILLLIFFETPAHAYTDPGSGLFLWQILAAGFVGVLFQLRKLADWFRGKKRN